MILFYGSTGHPGMELLYQTLRERDNVPAMFLVQEKFPRDVGLALHVPADGGFIAPPDMDPIAFDTVRSVCLDGYYIAPNLEDGFDKQDIEYIQTESWAALIAMFGQLSRRCLVANHVTRRDFTLSRPCELAYLASHGLPVPRLLVTSDPERASSSFDMLNGEVIYKTVSNRLTPFKQLVEADRERLDKITLAPVHFEEMPVGDICRCVVVGHQLFVHPAGMALPQSLKTACVQACQSLDVWLGEVTFRHHEGRWVATGLLTFPDVNSIAVPEILTACAELLEGGRPS